MIHEIKTSPAYDRRRETPNYGQHPLEFHFITRGDEGALVFTLVTGWYIEAQRRAQIGDSGSFATIEKSEYCLVNFHKRATIHDCTDHDPTDHCDWIGGPCVAHEPFGCTGKDIGNLFFTLLTEGLDALWREMDRHYEEITKCPA